MKESSTRQAPARVFLSYAQDDAAFAERFRKALADTGLEVSDPDRDHLPGENWAGEVARALEESEAMVVLLTPAAVGSPDVKRNIEYALGAKNYRNRLIPVVVGNSKRFPFAEIPWIVRRIWGLGYSTVPSWRTSESSQIIPSASLLESTLALRPSIPQLACL